MGVPGSRIDPDIPPRRHQGTKNAMITLSDLASLWQNDLNTLKQFNQ